MAQNPSEGKLIYHITHINNLPSYSKGWVTIPKEIVA